MGVYVDDMVITGNNSNNIKSFKKQMAKLFKTCGLGLLSYYPLSHKRIIKGKYWKREECKTVIPIRYRWKPN